MKIHPWLWAVLCQVPVWKPSQRVQFKELHMNDISLTHKCSTSSGSPGSSESRQRNWWRCLDWNKLDPSLSWSQVDCRWKTSLRSSENRNTVSVMNESFEKNLPKYPWISLRFRRSVTKRQRTHVRLLYQASNIVLI